MANRLRLNEKTVRDAEPADGRDYQVFDSEVRGFAVCVYRSGSRAFTLDSDARRAETTDPDQQRRSVGESALSGPGESSSYLKARTALTVYQAQERQIAIQKKKGALVDRARAETLVFRLARQERDAWVTWPARVAALIAAQVSAECESASGASVAIDTAIMQRVLEAHVREQLDALAELRVSLG